jgi:hypothetical protein
VLNKFGMDMSTPDNTKEINSKYVVSNFSVLQDKSQRNFLMIDKRNISIQSLRENVKDSIYYKGTSISLSIYKNEISWPLVYSPDNSYHLFLPNEMYTKKTDIKRKVLDPERSSPIVALQNEKHHNRLAVIGSDSIFSNESILKSKGDNLAFFQNLIKWLQFKTGIISTEFFKICNQSLNKDMNCSEISYSKPYQKIFVYLKLRNALNEDYLPEVDNIYLQIKMVEVFYNKAFQLRKIHGQDVYFVELEAFDHLGIFEFKVLHQKPGFYFDSPSINIIFKHYFDVNEDSSIFSIEGMPYLIILIALSISVMGVVLVGVSDFLEINPVPLTKNSSNSKKEKKNSKKDNKKSKKEK